MSELNFMVWTPPDKSFSVMARGSNWSEMVVDARRLATEAGAPATATIGLLRSNNRRSDYEAIMGAELPSPFFADDPHPPGCKRCGGREWESKWCCAACSEQASRSVAEELNRTARAMAASDLGLPA